MNPLAQFLARLRAERHPFGIQYAREWLEQVVIEEIKRQLHEEIRGLSDEELVARYDRWRPGEQDQEAYFINRQLDEWDMARECGLDPKP